MMVSAGSAGGRAFPVDDTPMGGDTTTPASGATPDPFGLVGVRLEGKYDIQSVVAEGGFGVVGLVTFWRRPPRTPPPRHSPSRVRPRRMLQSHVPHEPSPREAQS
jgi:hypothetical protein